MVNWSAVVSKQPFYTLRPRQNGRHFADDTFKRFFQNENVWISIKISLKFVPNAPINNIPSLVQIMAWRRPGDKPLSEPMMVSLPTHICVTRPQWVYINTDGIHESDSDQQKFALSKCSTPVLLSSAASRQPCPQESWVNLMLYNRACMIETSKAHTYLLALGQSYRTWVIFILYKAEPD